MQLPCKKFPLPTFMEGGIFTETAKLFDCGFYGAVPTGIFAGMGYAAVCR
jgi:hypothetical protein